MLNAEYEQAYISSFAKIFSVLKENYEVYVNPGTYHNYEIKINKADKATINDYLSICFQKQNGSLTLIASKNINKDIVYNLAKNISYALNQNPINIYQFNDLNDYIIYHFAYVKENTLIDNNLLLNNLLKNNEIKILSSTNKLNFL